jgi:hypothetical protein
MLTKISRWGGKDAKAAIKSDVTAVKAKGEEVVSKAIDKAQEAKNAVTGK